jgi:hypothetical protein
MAEFIDHEGADPEGKSKVALRNSIAQQLFWQ